MAITDLKGTTWEFTENVTAPTQTYRVYSAKKSAEDCQVEIVSASGIEYFGYPTVALNSGDGYYSLVFNYMNPVVADASGSTTAVGYRPGTRITFVSGLGLTNPDLIAWLEANATQVVESNPTTITYNGTEASIEAGQTATMACNGKKALTDITVVFGSAGTITYNGTETAVSAGQTATMACAGKKMLTDVVVAV